MKARKRIQADDLALALIENVDIDLDEVDVATMTDPIIYSYLENLGYEWTGEDLAKIGELP